MKLEDRAEVVNFNLAAQMGKHVIVGSCFAFLKPEFFANPAYSWLGKVLGRELGSRMNIVSLVTGTETELAGVKLKAKTFSCIDLSSITSDKSLYKADEDTIDLLLVNPLLADSDARINVLSNGNPYSQHVVRIAAHGAGKLTLQDLPAGEYEVYFDLCTNRERYCKFTVAQYKLVPLVASLVQKQMRSDGKLEMTVKLSSFGLAVNGAVQIELFDRATRQTVLRGNAKDGLLTFGVELQGEGPHSLNFQFVNEPSKTASLPIIGSRATERSQTQINPLGNELLASLLPSDGAREVRGLYLTEGALVTTPVKLELDDDLKPVLKTTAALNSLLIVSIDPKFPRARLNAIDVERTVDPSQFDPEYQAASNSFESGKEAEALKIFQKAHAKQANPHAFYAYFEACCHSRMGNVEAALQSLRESIRDGFKDFEHMQNDPDLESLHGNAEFESLKTGGVTEFKFEDLAANQVIAVPFRPSLTVLAMAADVKGQPWEGWTSYVKPSEIALEVKAEAEYKSGHSMDLKLSVSGESADNCAAYVIVKDARLLGQDKPEARLAAALKNFIEEEQKSLRVGFQKDSVERLAATQQYASRYATDSAWGAAAPGSGGGWNQAASANDSWGSASPMAFQETGFSAPPPPTAPAPPTGGLQRSRLVAKSAGQPQPRPESGFVKVNALMSEAAPMSLSDSAGVRLRKAFSADSSAKSEVGEVDEQSAVALQKGHEPEVLFADFVELKKGVATLEVLLPLQESDYVVECFVILKEQWCAGETRFRAVSDPLAEFTLPRFVNQGEQAVGWLHVSSRSEELICQVYHDGKEIELKHEGAPFEKSQKVAKEILNLSFAAEPGRYRAVLTNDAGKVVLQIEQTIDEPGKLKHHVRTVRLLQAGESIDLRSEDSQIALRVLPGLSEKFNLLVEATASYGHACCEQTAAKILSACAMFIFAGDDRKIRDTASSIIIAGIRREETMWLRQGGFKSYPERPNVADLHYGPQAAQHLANLALLEPEFGNMSRDLHDSVKKGLEMSEDAMRAYKISFPPTQLQSMRDAYHVCRFSQNGVKEKAIEYIRQRVADPEKFLKEVSSPSPYLGVAVGARIEAAYAAAALVRSRQAHDLSSALPIANHVVRALNEQGRLYSTLDSVAAIALFSELSLAKVSGGGGKVEVNGVLQEMKDILVSLDPVESIRCVEGVAAVEVERIVEEDWSAFASSIPVRVMLEKNDQAQRSFKLADLVNLHVRLEDGYKDGDLLWICLPDCLSRVYGGGQVKLFSIDFEGKDELVVPLAVTGSTKAGGKSGKQNLAICVRNMFNEERGANPGLVPISAD